MVGTHPKNTIMKLKVEQDLYNGDTWGSGTDMVHFGYSVPYYPTTAQVKEFIRAVRKEINNMSYENIVYGDYDCTGKLFGSRWERVCYSITDVAMVVTYLHHYSMDI